MINGYSRRRGHSAFTLVEVLMVVVIMAIAGALIVPQLLASGTLGIQAAARMVIADILYAQNEAIAHQSTRRVVFEPANERYRLTDGGGMTLTVSWKGGGADNYEIDFVTDKRFQGVELNIANFAGTAVLEFDALGAPIAGGKVELTFGTTRYRVKVAPFTGRVTVEQVS